MVEVCFKNGYLCSFSKISLPEFDSCCFKIASLVVGMWKNFGNFDSSYYSGIIPK